MVDEIIIYDNGDFYYQNENEQSLNEIVFTDKIDPLDILEEGCNFMVDVWDNYLHNRTLKIHRDYIPFCEKIFKGRNIKYIHSDLTFRRFYDYNTS